ncbi:MAG: helix-turn-helix domain-containing protein [Prevotella sp.]|jgi:transcriptional regulator with XRE-family HTH domain|nr:helix-turn-helix domain-containing protein [Prevotella sp.]
MKIYWDGKSKNIIGTRVKELRKAMVPTCTQLNLAEKLQLSGCDIDRITIVRIENGLRFVPDYEVKAIASVLGVTPNDLLCDNDDKIKKTL